jgi:RNA 2',3'-cyclic 3'-phosphodiesterase
MSLFVAVRPSEDAVRHLDAAVAPLRSAPRDGLRWTAPESWHLTVCFLGSVAEDRRPDLEARLVRAASRHRPLSLQLAGGGHFGSRVLFAKVLGDVTEASRLAASVTAAARRAHVPVDERPYRPHLTLARSRGTTPLRPLAERLHSYAGPPWVVEGILLMESRPTGVAGRAPAYSVVDRFMLAEAAPEAAP